MKAQRLAKIVYFPGVDAEDVVRNRRRRPRRPEAAERGLRFLIDENHGGVHIIGDLILDLVQTEDPALAARLRVDHDRRFPDELDTDDWAPRGAA